MEPQSTQSITTSGNTLAIDFLIKLIPESFDGDRFKLRSFIKQVDAVFELASEAQTPALLLFVKSKIKGKAREQIDIHCNLTSWQDISELLISLYQDKKTLDQLLEELSSTRQLIHESVSQFYQRLEDINSRILAIIHSTENDVTKLSGRISMINDVTLNRFIYHTQPQISQMLRYREFECINKALTAAIAEEKVLKLTPRSFPKQSYSGGSNKFNNNPNNTTANRNQFRSVNFNQSNANNREIKKCNYCRNLGHNIDECRKRMYNNSKRAAQNTANNSRAQDTSRAVNFQSAETEDQPPDQQQELEEQFADLHW